MVWLEELSMSASPRAYEFDVEDVEYLRHRDEALLARLYTPRGEGPFPAVIEIHGGAWSRFDRTRDQSVHEALARSGVVVMAIDFRQGETHPYPQALADINYAIRWLKSNAKRFRIRPDQVGMSGNSSGGHLTMLSAMRFDHPAYTSIPVPGHADLDARLAFVLLLWPVINPLGRYRHAVRRSKLPDPPDWAEQLPALHEEYWQNEENMADGNPMLILERGEKTALPPFFGSNPTSTRSTIISIQSPIPAFRKPSALRETIDVPEVRLRSTTSTLR